jgi:uncharacterized protein
MEWFQNMARTFGIGWRHPHYRELLERRPALDFLEVHSENFFADGGAALSVLLQGRAHYPVSLHGVGLSLGAALGVDAWHLDKLARLVERVEPVRVSDHASFARASFTPASASTGANASSLPVHAADLLPIPFNRAALDVLCANVQAVQERLKRPILVENLSAYVRWKPSSGDAWLGEVQFLTLLARRTGCQLLVDVNNLFVNALNDQPATGHADTAAWAARAVGACTDWLNAIPPADVGELHVAGHCRMADEHGEIAIDDHGSPVCAEVWRLHALASQRFEGVPTLVEWDTDVPDLDILLAEVQTARINTQRPDASLQSVTCP